MKSNWQVLMILHADGFIVYFHVVVDSLLVTQMIIIFLLGVDLQIM